MKIGNVDGRSARAGFARVFRLEYIVVLLTAILAVGLLWMTLGAVRELNRGGAAIRAARHEWRELWDLGEMLHSDSDAHSRYRESDASLLAMAADIRSTLTSTGFDYLARVSKDFGSCRRGLLTDIDRLAGGLVIESAKGGTGAALSGNELRNVGERFDRLSTLMDDLSQSELDSFQALLGFMLILLLALSFALIRRSQTLRSLQEKMDAERSFSRLLEASIEAERTRLAREIHDDIAQDLVFARHELDALALDLPIAAARFQGIKEALGVTLGTARALCEGLRPPRIDASGSLTRFLAAFCAEMRGRWNVEISIALDDSIDRRLDEGLSLSFFRIAQEGITNACKHSGASRVNVALRVESAGGGAAFLVVEDEGRGMGQAAEGLGMRGLRERVKLLGGEAVWREGPSGGTILSVRVPLDRQGERKGP
jgi:signal transduction histidine kinase